MGKPVDITNQTFGRLTAKFLCEKRNAQGLRLWHCECICGKEIDVPVASLRRANTTSCGCYARELNIVRSTKHGLRNTPEWHIWAQMIGRCTNPKNKSYKNYGGRGIMIENLRWFHFEYFIEDVGFRPDPKLSLDRLDNDRGYSEDNTAWRTRKDQSRNRRGRIWIEFRGEKRILSDWCEVLSLNYPKARNKIVAQKKDPKEVFSLMLKENQNSVEYLLETPAPLNVQNS